MNLTDLASFLAKQISISAYINHKHCVDSRKQASCNESDVMMRVGKKY